MGSALSGCSMIGLGGNDGFDGYYYPDQAPQAQSQYGGCNFDPCANQQVLAEPVYQTQQAPIYQQDVYGQEVYGQEVYGQDIYGQGVQVQQPYSYPVQSESVYAQGSSVPAYTAPGVYAGQAGLRGPASANQSYLYGSLGAVLYDTNTDLFGAQARLGWQSASCFGAEVEGSLGVAEDNNNFDFGTGVVPAEIEVDNQIAAFAVARLPLGKKLNVLGRYGYHRTELSAEADIMGTEVEDDFTTDGIAYGGGVEYSFSPKTSIRADYTRYDFDGPDTDSVSLAISQKF